MAKQELLDILVKIESRLSSLETIGTYQENHLKNIDSHLEAQNGRIRKSENSISRIYGIGAAVVFLIGIGITLLKVLG